MYNANRPDASELPSTAKLLKSTGVAIVVAGLLLATVVLPAEYGVDPTRAGSILGLTEMGRIKRSLAAEAEAEAAAAAEPAVVSSASAGNLMPPSAIAAASAPTGAASGPSRSLTHETRLTLAPDQGAEIKLMMRSGARAEYEWSTDGGRVNYDVHADAPGTSYHGYGRGTEARMSGVLTAAFDGNHGWFWRNRTDNPVTVTLRTSGDYQNIQRID